MKIVKLGTAAVCLLLAIQVQATPVSAGLQLWLDAADTTTVFDTNGVNAGQVGFNGRVMRWSDKSGALRDATSSPTTSPSYNATAMNGRPAITFDGDGQYLDLASTVSSIEETIFVVTRMFDNGTNRGPWLGNSTAGAHGRPGAFFNDEDRYFVGTTDGLWGFVDESAPTDDTIVMEIRTASSVNVLENGYTVLAGLYASNAMAINTVGWFPYTGQKSFWGEISEILFYDRALADAEVIAVQDYLSGKYAIETASLIAEPATLALLGLGLVGLGLTRRHQSLQLAGRGSPCRR